MTTATTATKATPPHEMPIQAATEIDDWRSSKTFVFAVTVSGIVTGTAATTFKPTGVRSMLGAASMRTLAVVPGARPTCLCTSLATSMVTVFDSADDSVPLWSWIRLENPGVTDTVRRLSWMPS